MKIFVWIMCWVALATPLMAEGSGHDHGHDHAMPKAAHGGQVLEIGHHVAFIEVVHDLKSGKVFLYLMDHDGNKMGVGNAPRLNLTYQMGKDKKKKQVITKAINLKNGKSNEFEASDDLFKSEDFSGRISLKIGKKTYQVELSHDHHDHGDHGHEH